MNDQTDPFSEEFNWLAFLEQACAPDAERVVPSERYRVGCLARSWPTCACGQLCKSLPRDAHGAPHDRELLRLGTKFHVLIYNRDWKSALELFHQIEERTAHLLNYSNNKKHEPKD